MIVHYRFYKCHFMRLSLCNKKKELILEIF
jgi:hypothetical protein